MRANDKLKLHFVNVNHGDATIIEFPDYDSRNMAYFAVVDLGAKRAADRGKAKDYLKELIELRRNNDNTFDYSIEFVCVTHPHNDHYGGLSRFMNEFSNKVKMFWDCGFRTNSPDYNSEISRISSNKKITFIRVAAGMEFEFGDTRITVLAPSVDLANRFDTYGVDKNNSSIVLKIKFNRSYAILAGDAEFASWGKSTEEFPRQEGITFFRDALGLAERGETSDQLKCNLLKISHHGSKHGSSLEYLERLKPRHVVIPAGDQQWYQDNYSNGVGYFPHELTTKILQVLNASDNLNMQIHTTGISGNILFKYGAGPGPEDFKSFRESPSDSNFLQVLDTNWA
jgi:beta-lactamase superfamily II metal-dependent hydrolase